MYGYEIMVSLGAIGNGEFRLKQGTLYPLLYRMEREGYISAKWETPDNGKKRKVYSLTSTGKTAAAKHLEEWKRFSKAVNSILEEVSHD